MLYKLCLIAMSGMNLIIYIFIYYCTYLFIRIYIYHSITLFGSTHFILSNWYFHGLFGGKLQCLRWRSNFFAQTSMQSALLKTSCCFRRMLFSIRISTVETGTHSWPHLSVCEFSQNIIFCDVSSTRCVLLLNVQHLLILTVIIYQII